MLSARSQIKISTYCIISLIYKILREGRAGKEAGVTKQHEETSRANGCVL